MKYSDIDIPYKKGNPLKHLEPLLRTWINIHKSYCDDNPGEDSLYWYNERANTSVLAGAIWKNRGIAFEEFSVDKKHRKRRWSGRADLWFSWNNNDYIVEAKEGYVSLSQKAYECTDTIEKLLGVARKEAVATRKGVYADYALGIVFVLPYIPENEVLDMSVKLKMLIKEIKKIDYDIMAYVFPKSSRELWELYIDRSNEIGYYYPGIVLVGRVTRRG